MSSATARFDREGDGYIFGLARVGFGILLALQTLKALNQALSQGYFGSVFHLPIVPELLVPSAPVYFALLALQLIGAGLVISGWFAREALALSALTGIYLMLCDRLDYHNNRFVLLLLAFLCAFTPCDRSFVFGRGRAHTLPPELRRGPIWAQRLLAFQISAVYLSSGGGKLLDPDWRGGQTMQVRFAEGVQFWADQGLPSPRAWVELATAPWVASLASKSAISLELLLAFGLWWPRTRAFALWAGVLFHLGIEIGARVELFSWVMGVGYVAAFVTPELRERTLEIDGGSSWGRRLLRAAPYLDWLARFRWIEVSGHGHALVAAVERDGSRVTGLRALTNMSRGIPLFFPVWGPLALLSRLLARPAGRS